MEVRRKRPDFPDFIGRSDHDVFGVAVESPQGSDDVADIGTDAEISNAPDIYGDPHGESIKLFLSRPSGTLEAAELSAPVQLAPGHGARDRVDGPLQDPIPGVECG